MVKELKGGLRGNPLDKFLRDWGPFAGRFYGKNPTITSPFVSEKFSTILNGIHKRARAIVLARQGVTLDVGSWSSCIRVVTVSVHMLQMVQKL